MKKEFYTVKEVMEILDCSRQTVYNLTKPRNDGSINLPSYNILGHRRYKISDFEKWIEEGKVN